MNERTLRIAGLMLLAILLYFVFWYFLYLGLTSSALFLAPGFLALGVGTLFNLHVVFRILD